MGKISKIILRDICTTPRTALTINQWCNTNDCIKWFTDYDENNKCSFIQYDIREFDPSITEKSVDEALKLAKEYIEISEDKINIIKHCRKSILYHIMRNCGFKRVWVVTSIIPWLHSTGLSCPYLFGANCYTTSISLLTPATMFFMGMMGWLLGMTVRLEKII